MGANDGEKGISMTTQEQIWSVIRSQLFIEKMPFDPHATIYSLGGDSIDESEIIMELEEEFDIELDSRDEEKIRMGSMEEIVRVIERNLP